jgi:hypothetical protein
MKFSLIFNNSGDTIPFDPVNQELLEFYIGQLDQQSLNGFSPMKKDYGEAILNVLQKFHVGLVETNEWLDKLVNLKFDVCDIENYLDQYILNKIHAEWANFQSLTYNIQQKRKEYDYMGIAEQIHDMFSDDIQHPTLTNVLDKLNLIEMYYSLNLHIHDIESRFDNIRYTTGDSWTIVSKNSFSKNLLTNNLANLRLSFNHLGRTLYNKFINFDVNLEHNDENSFNELLGFVTISLNPTQTIPLSSEYVNWCKRHNRTPIGNYLNIGNIPDVSENLTKYRIIIFRNLLKNNKFSINKG